MHVMQAKLSKAGLRSIFTPGQRVKFSGGEESIRFIVLNPGLR